MKRPLKHSFFFILSVLTIMQLHAQWPLNINQIPLPNTNGLEIYLPFNGNTTNYGNSSKTATNYGALYSAGICGQALNFDGFNDYVKITPYINLSGDYTITTWIYLDTLTYEQEIFTTREQCPTTYRRFSQAELALNHNLPSSSLQTDRLLYMINKHQGCTGYATGDRYEPPSIVYNAGNWFFIALTVQNNSNENRVVDFYMNCQHLSTNLYLNTTTSQLFGNGFNYKTYIGGGPNIGNYSYSIDGKIDEFRLFNRVLSWGEIQNLYYQCKPLDISINKYLGNCTGDSVYIQIINSEDSVQYQLFDSTNQQFIGNSQLGGCNNLPFNTGLVTTSTDFYIKATHTGSNNTIVLDTVISLNPTTGGSIYFDSIKVCLNDSIFVRGKFYTPPTNAIDTFVNSTGCDSILNTFIQAITTPVVSLGNDTSFCAGDSILLSVPNIYDSVLWSNNSNQNSIYVNTQGTYWVEVTDSNCKSIDSIHISNLSFNYITINDTSFCNDQNWTISLPSAYTYLWSTGNSSPSILIQDSGQYWVNITDYCKNYNVDFSVELVDCSCMMAVPNVFTPNNDGVNDYFFPVINCEFQEYHIAIFNRWGQLLFESDDQNKKWDGEYKGKEIAEGVYFYVINYKLPYSNSNKSGARARSGSITIIR